MLTIKRSITYLSWHRCISKSIFLGFIWISIELSLPWFFYGVVLLKQSQGRTKLAHWCIAMVGNVTAISFYIVTTRQLLQQRTLHYDDVIMTTIAAQITSLPSVYSTVYSGPDQSKHQSSASLAFVWGIHRGPVNSPHKWPVTRKMFPFDDVIMRPGQTTSKLLGSLLLTSFNTKLCMGKWLPSSL